ncbi:hypothetical protein EDB86DRAFT_3005925 [Lactarius hatsudake]|nr:hypothetical protein EDB86DRAFT_3005925 [Lactarius hatsudake]
MRYSHFSYLYALVLRDVIEYLMPGFVPPLVATVGINGKVSFLEKGSESDYYRGFKNSTGAYELDSSFVHDFLMPGVRDMFCSAAVVLLLPFQMISQLPGMFDK